MKNISILRKATQKDPTRFHQIAETILTICKTKNENLRFSANPWKSSQDTWHITGCPLESWKSLES